MSSVTLLPSSESRRAPKFLEKLLMPFPFYHFLTIAIATYRLVQHASLLNFFLLVFFIYLLPLLIWRTLAIFYPLKEGSFEVGTQTTQGSAWMLNHRIQYLFLAFQIFERILLVIPGAFSAWLRLWGSKIGKNVIWTPRVEVLDRSLLSIADHCFFGDQVNLSAHSIVKSNGKLILFVKWVVIEQKSLIGFQSVLGPGSFIKANSFVPATSLVYSNQQLRLDLKLGYYVKTQCSHPQGSQK